MENMRKNDFFHQELIGAREIFLNWMIYLIEFHLEVIRARKWMFFERG